MGVNGLWPALDQASAPVTAEDLRGKVLAVDLSIWLVEACTSKLLKTEHKHPHLFLTLSRASFLLRHGALPIVVVEGARHPRKRWKSDRPDPGRAALAAWSRQAARLLRALGVPTLVAAGEAEACCARLTATGVADGVVTEDGDALLYGATRVVRGATVDGLQRLTARVYDAAALPWSRRELVALGLLCGTDLDAGARGVGPVRAAAFVASRRGSETDALDALRRWRDDDGDDSVVDLCDDDDDDADDGEIAAYCAAHKWPPEDLVATYLADEPMPRRAFRWRRPSVDALAFANAERCVHGFHARPSLRYVLARVARLVD